MRCLLLLRLFLKYYIPTLDHKEALKIYVFGKKTCVGNEVSTIFAIVAKILYSKSRPQQSVDTYLLWEEE